MIQKKKLLFVNNNMKIGGVQKALLEVLKAVHRDYDITLLLFRKTGALLDQIPEDITVIETASHYRYLGVSQGECQKPADRLLRGTYAAAARLLGISWAVPLMDLTAGRDALPKFDLAVSFLHCAKFKAFYGGTPEYTLHNVRAGHRACYIHCDFLRSGTCSPHSKRIYRQYDQMICVSDSVRASFLSALPELADRTAVLRNPVDADKIRRLSEEDPFPYDTSWLNILTVARLASEKGIERIIRAMAPLSDKPIRYYILGDGPMRSQLQELIRQARLEQQVFLMGEQKNPYAWMAGADLLAVPSYHEAAPVVFQEAAVLGLPVLTTRTLSAEEMVPPSRGMVIDNTEEAIGQALAALAEAPLPFRWPGGFLYDSRDLQAEFAEEFRSMAMTADLQTGGDL